MSRNEAILHVLVMLFMFRCHCVCLITLSQTVLRKMFSHGFDHSEWYGYECNKGAFVCSYIMWLHLLKRKKVESWLCNHMRHVV